MGLKEIINGIIIQVTNLNLAEINQIENRANFLALSLSWLTLFHIRVCFKHWIKA